MRIPYGKITLALCYDCKRQLFCNRCHIYKQVSGILYIILHLLKTAKKCYHCPCLSFFDVANVKKKYIYAPVSLITTWQNRGNRLLKIIRQLLNALYLVSKGHLFIL